MQTLNWLPYHEVYTHPHASVAGTIRVATAVASPQLHNQRPILVYLPPTYAYGRRRYPVLYMHDGQNLFDHVTSYAGEWGVDETMEALSRDEGLDAIVVGIPNMGAARMDEYSPFRDGRHGGGMGNQYLAFVVNTLKPIIDRDFRTLPGKRYTGMMGSSMGGLISLYAFFRYPEVFGFAGIMSPSLWVAKGTIFSFAHAAPFNPGKIYLDVGTRELGDSPTDLWMQRTRSRRYYASVRQMKRILVRKGYRPVHDLLHIEEKWADHSETSWARRLPDAVRFFLRNTGHGR
ncbi:MAG: alpha/beta hydrolase [Anaerolineales bacterium]|nr:alpha/beta hydrolase [Anaerolineales bacterium]